MVRHRRVKQERAAVEGSSLVQCGPYLWDHFRPLGLPCVVTMTRVGPRPLDDDNLREAMKAVRDQIAMRLGVKDAPKDPVQWHYQQRRGAVREWAVEVKVEAADIKWCTTCNGRGWTPTATVCPGCKGKKITEGTAYGCT